MHKKRMGIRKRKILRYSFCEARPVKAQKVTLSTKSKSLNCTRRLKKIDAIGLGILKEERKIFLFSKL